jgi:hypothetical protein
MAIALGQSAFAQASRTWVSGVGDDVNPCSRTAPCKTWAGAISKTANGGEIDALDPGGFGGVTITKNLTIDGKGQVASDLNAGGINGIIINAAGIAVTLRNMEVQGINTGLNAVRIVSAASVTIDNCKFTGQTGAGISDVRTTAGTLNVFNTTIGPGSGASSTGIVVDPGAVLTFNKVTIYNTVITNVGSHGIHFKNGVRGSIANSSISFCGGSGIRAEQTVANTTEASVDATTIHECGNGLETVGTGAILRLSNNTVTFNITNGFLIGAGSTMFTFGHNRFAGNGGNQSVGLVAASPAEQ